jgi:hypothetical protein
MTGELERISPDAPLRLDQAVRAAFPLGGMTVSGLRREAARGRLAIETIAGKQFTTLRAIEEMRERCRVQPKEPDFGSSPPKLIETEKSPATRVGSSVTVRERCARAALERTARELNKTSPNTSAPNTSRRATADVIPLKS